MTDLLFTLPFTFQEFKNNPTRTLTRVKFVTARSSGKTSAMEMLVVVLYTTAAAHKKRMRGQFLHQNKGHKRRRHKIRNSWLDGATDTNAERRLNSEMIVDWGLTIRFCPPTVLAFQP